MMKQLSWLTALACLAAMAAAGLADNEKVPKDPAEAFQGEWIVASVFHAGFELRGTPERPIKATITQNKLVISPGVSIGLIGQLSINSVDNELKTASAVFFRMSDQDRVETFQLDPSKTPAEIDTKEKVGDDVSERKGIYRWVDGELEICLGVAGHPRPKGFKAGDRSFLLHLKRPARKP